MYAQNTEKDCCLVREVPIQRSDAHAGPLGNARCSETLRAFLLPAACSRRMAGQNFRLRRYQALTALFDPSHACETLPRQYRYS